MHPSPARLLQALIIPLLLWSAVACQAAETEVPTLTPTSTSTSTPTVTHTPTITPTATLAFTITPQPTMTPSITLTPYPTLSPTPSPSQAPLQPAVLFPFRDTNDRVVDWSYIHVTQIGFNRLNEINDLWAFVSFQLLDRAIHQRNFDFLGKTITVYYLNVAHEFDGELLPMQLVLGGTAGENVAIEDIPAGGNAYVQVRVLEASDLFAPYITHRDANRDYELREETYPLIFLKDLRQMLPTLPDELILLADHPILFPQDDWPQIKLDMQRVDHLAARYHPFFEIDDYGRLANQSEFALALRDHIFRQTTIPLGFYAFSSQTLVIIEGGQ